MKFIYVLIILLCTQLVQAQTIRGSVMNEKTQEALPGATIQWLYSKNGTVTNPLGAFEIAYPTQTPDFLIVRYLGFVNDTIRFNNQLQLHVRLKPDLQLSEVEIREKREDLSFNTIQAINKQTLNVGELKKAACCNLSESFETNATVDVSFSDALSGTKQIKMLGLDGSYTQILSELQPSIRGLSTNYGLAHTPGTWIESIDITKGIGSVVNGYESMAGQINIELQKPEKSDRLLFNLYAGDFGRYEANINAAHKFNKRWSSMLLLHSSTITNKNDFNKDGFIDMATGYQLSAMNRWKYENPGKIMAGFGVFVNVDERLGGQLDYSKREDNDLKRFYGVQINTRHVEGFGKAAIGFAGKPYKSLGIMSTARAYQHRAFFGPKTYHGEENSVHSNLMYQSIISTSEHKLKTGFSHLYDQFNESYNDSVFVRTENVPGAYVEYNYDNIRKVSVLAGVRSDYHNLFGMLINPRLHIKYNLKPTSVLRVSAGRGMRVANVFIENAAVMASGRTVIVEETFRPEVAWNYGVSLTHKFKLLKKNSTVVLDYFYTDFENQVVVDFDRNPQALVFYNLKGLSYSKSFQAEWIYEPIKQFEARLAYKWQDVRTTYDGVLLHRPLVSRSRALFNLAYATRFEKWKFDFTAKWFDRSRIPARYEHAAHLVASNLSPDYFVYNAQVTRKFKHIEWYVGGENLSNYMQHHQIADAANPFGNKFDASLIWGPVMGRVFYTGFRYTIK